MLSSSTEDVICFLAKRYIVGVHKQEFDSSVVL